PAPPPATARRCAGRGRGSRTSSRSRSCRSKEKGEGKREKGERMNETFSLLPFPFSLLHSQLLFQSAAGQVFHHVERLALAAGGGELDRPHAPGHLQGRLVQHCAALADPHQ